MYFFHSTNVSKAFKKIYIANKRTCYIIGVKKKFMNCIYYKIIPHIWYMGIIANELDIQFVVPNLYVNLKLKKQLISDIHAHMLLVE